MLTSEEATCLPLVTSIDHRTIWKLLNTKPITERVGGSLICRVVHFLAKQPLTTTLYEGDWHAATRAVIFLVVWKACL